MNLYLKFSVSPEQIKEHEIYWFADTALRRVIDNFLKRGVFNSIFAQGEKVVLMIKITKENLQ